MSSETIPVIDIKPLIDNTDRIKVSQQIADALKTWGFFYITGHGVDVTLQQEVDKYSAQFFAQPLEEKRKLINKSGPYRGYMGIGPETYSGRQSVREALDIEYNVDNIYPQIPYFRQTIDRYASEMMRLTEKLLEAIALSLGIREDYFKNLMPLNDMTRTLSLIHYPPVEELSLDDENQEFWGIGDHSDFGHLTILKQDNRGGLQVKSLNNEWIDAIPIENTFICNIGDMLDKMTGGLYRSTVHRVVLIKGHRARKSIAYFVSPNYEDKISLIEGIENSERAILEEQRCDGISAYKWSGKYGDYVEMKSRIANVDFKEDFKSSFYIQ